MKIWCAQSYALRPCVGSAGDNGSFQDEVRAASSQLAHSERGAALTFIWPAMLGLLVLIPAFVAVYVWMQQQRQGLAAMFGNPALVRDSSGTSKSGRQGLRRHVPPLLFLL